MPVAGGQTRSRFNWKWFAILTSLGVIFPMVASSSILNNINVVNNSISLAQEKAPVKLWLLGVLAAIIVAYVVVLILGRPGSAQPNGAAHQHRAQNGGLANPDGGQPGYQCGYFCCCRRCSVLTLFGTTVVVGVGMMLFCPILGCQNLQRYISRILGTAVNMWDFGVFLVFLSVLFGPIFLRLCPEKPALQAPANKRERRRAEMADDRRRMRFRAAAAGSPCKCIAGMLVGAILFLGINGIYLSSIPDR